MLAFAIAFMHDFLGSSFLAPAPSFQMCALKPPPRCSLSHGFTYGEESTRVSRWFLWCTNAKMGLALLRVRSALSRSPQKIQKRFDWFFNREKTSKEFFESIINQLGTFWRDFWMSQKALKKSNIWNAFRQPFFALHWNVGIFDQSKTSSSEFLNH